MDIATLKLSSQALTKLGKLAIAIELKMGVRIRFRDRIEDMMEIMKHAMSSDNPDVKAACHVRFVKKIKYSVVRRAVKAVFQPNSSFTVILIESNGSIQTISSPANWPCLFQAPLIS